MRVFAHRTPSGDLRAIEVENLWLRRRGAIDVVRAIPGVVIVREGSGFDDDEFCVFMVNDVRFAIEEPFGDNSRYWISTDESEHHTELAIICDAFLKARRPEWFSLRLVVVLILVVVAYNVSSNHVAPSIWRRSLAGGCLFVSVALLARWLLALARGDYRSRIVEDAAPVSR